ncbi:hypothetical protein SNEBB_007605 [Seison nebaliae]|nr:hypothetical protein SNEBB_007605 [Seison nebaliae]
MDFTKLRAGVSTTVFEKAPHYEDTIIEGASIILGSSEEDKCRERPNISKGYNIINQSENDTLLYRYIQLRNGLRALLIHKPTEQNVLGLGKIDDDDNSGSDDDSDTNDYDKTYQMDYKSLKDSTVSYGTSLSSYQQEEFAAHNTDSALPMENFESRELKAACCAVVHAGHSNNPNEYPGMAHLVEHMIFLGSKKYPKPHSMETLINIYNGKIQAQTQFDKTIFEFNIDHDHLFEALDVFAHLFVSPLFTLDGLLEQLNVLDQEYETAKTSDDIALQHSILQLAHRSCVLKRFFYGSTDSLNSKKQLSQLRMVLNQWFQQYYTSLNITLTVFGYDSLDLMQTWVEDTFCMLKYNMKGTTDNELEHEFKQKDFNTFHRIIPHSKINRLTLTWALPNLNGYWKSKPLLHVKDLLESQHDKGLSSYLHTSNYISDMSVEIDFKDQLANDLSSFISVSLTLTDQGTLNVAKVIGAILLYLQTLTDHREELEPFFSGIKRRRDTRFRFPESETPLQQVRRLAISMQSYPTQNVVDGDQLVFECNEDLIVDILAHMASDTFHVTLQSYNYDGTCEDVEPVFENKQTLSDIPVRWRKFWTHYKEGVGRRPDFSPPGESLYTAGNFFIYEKNVETSTIPVILKEGTGYRAYYVKDSIYKVPKAVYCFHFQHPIVYDSPLNFCMFELFFLIFRKRIRPHIQQAQSSNLHCKILQRRSGLLLTFSGFNDSLPVLYFKIISELANFTATYEEYEYGANLLSELYQKGYQNYQLMICDLECVVLLNDYWPLSERKRFLPLANLDIFTNFMCDFLSQFYVDVLFEGNILPMQALRLLQFLLIEFERTPIPSNRLRPERNFLIPKRSTHYIRVNNPNEDSCYSVYHRIFQIGGLLIKNFVALQILRLLMRKPLMDNLVKKFQLVIQTMNIGIFVHAGRIHFSITIIYKDSPTLLSGVGKAVDETISSLRNDILFGKVRQIFTLSIQQLFAQKLNLNKVLTDQVNNHWQEIVHKNQIFDRNELELEEVRYTTTEQMEYILKSFFESEKCASILILVAPTSRERIRPNTVPNPDENINFTNLNQWGRCDNVLGSGSLINLFESVIHQGNDAYSSLEDYVHTDGQLAQEGFSASQVVTMATSMSATMLSETTNRFSTFSNTKDSKATKQRSVSHDQKYIDYLYEKHKAKAPRSTMMIEPEKLTKFQQIQHTTRTYLQRTKHLTTNMTFEIGFIDDDYYEGKGYVRIQNIEAQRHKLEQAPIIRLAPLHKKHFPI